MMSIADQAPAHIRAISPYVPGKPITELARQMGLPVDSIVKLASNENPRGMSRNARTAVSGRRLETFFDSHNIEYRSAGMFSFGSKSTVEPAHAACKRTLVVERWR